MFQSSFLFVCLYELLYRGSLKTGGSVKATLLQLHDTLVKLKNEYHEECAFKRPPLYLRINTLKTSSQPSGVVRELELTLPGVTFTGDPHVNFLLRFPPDTNFSTCPVYREGRGIIQDKASCLPAVVLAPPAHSVVLDACAAPGNKTLHLAALMNNTGQVFAVEKDLHRYRRLQGNVTHYGARNITCVHADFLQLDPKEYHHVTHLLVDPSCSGSGMVTRRVTHGDTPPARIAALANLQVTILRKALSFPSATRVVYSTCSLHEDENEHVVRKVLEEEKGEWRLERALPDWHRRGHPDTFEGADKCVRCCPEADQTNGFFLACFVRDLKGTEHPMKEKPRFKFHNILSVYHVSQRYKIKYHYKYPYKFHHRGF